MSEPPRLLETLLAAWKSAPHPRVGDAVDGLTLALLAHAPRPALTASRRQVDLDTWRQLEAARDPLDFPRLMAAARGGAQADVQRQLDTLAQWRHPGFARGLLTLLEAPPYAGMKSRPLLQRVLHHLVETRDARAAAPARALSARYFSVVNSSTGEFVLELLERAAATLDAAAPDAPLDAAIARACSEAEQRSPPAPKPEVAPTLAPRELEALLDVVSARPEDDAPRAVLADALLAAGDVRGEFIRRQLAGQPTHELLKHPTLAAWLQPLQRAGVCAFQRGLPHRIDLYKTALKTVKEPLWRTVRVVTDVEKLSAPDAARLLDAPTLQNVRHVSRLTDVQLEALGPTPRPWTHVVVNLLNAPARDALRRFPQVEDLKLSVRGRVHADFFDATPRLTRLALTVEGVLEPEALARLPGLKSLELRGGDSDGVQLPPSLEHCTVSELTNLRFGPAVHLRTVTAPSRAFSHDVHLPTLERLSLAVGEERRPLPPGLAAVRHLELFTGPQTSLPLDFFGALTALQSLRIGYGRAVTGAHLAGLTSLTAIAGLWGALREVPPLPGLLAFECMAPRDLDDVAALLSSNPQLEYLDLQWNSHCPLFFHPQGFSEAAGAWRRLKAVVEPSKVRILGVHPALALVREPRGWSALLRAGAPGESVTWLLDAVGEVFH